MKKKPVDKAGKKSVIPVQPKKKPEEDADDLVHEEKQQQPADAGEKDPDDVVHSTLNNRAATTEDNLEDPDDLVHDPREEEEE